MSTLIFNKRPLDLEEDQRNSKRFKRNSFATSSNDYISLPSLENIPDFKVNKLRVLFPYMTEEIISGVLTNCSQNVEAAIDALNNLNLSDSPKRNGQDNNSKMTTSSSSLEESKGPSTSNEQSESKIHQRAVEEGWRQEKLNRVAHDYGRGLIDQVQNTTNVVDAANFAKMAFKEYERQVLQEYEVEKVPKLEDENESLKEHLNTLIRDVSLLKRAVVVQNKMHQANQEKINEADALKEENDRLRAELQSEKMNNYTLQCYLKMNEGGQMNMNNPDIF